MENLGSPVAFFHKVSYVASSRSDNGDLGAGKESVDDNENDDKKNIRPHK
jgi:hypothetical protein